MPDGETQIAMTGFPAMPPKIAAAVAAVMQKVPKLGKAEKNLHGNYKFAGIDAFLEAVRPLCAEAGLIIAQDEEHFELVDGGQGKDGKPRKWLLVRYRFALLGSGGEVWQHRPTRTIMVDASMGSQSFGAAQSYALKQFQRSLFQIATGENEDADTHEPADLPARGATKDTSPPPQVKAKAETKPARNFEPPLAEQPAIKKWCDEKFDHIAQITHVDRLLELENDPEFAQAMERLQHKWAMQYNRLRTLIKEKYVELEPANA